ncbi:MAG: phosphate ABC transporter substrate-binding protein PstS [Thermoplasmata archaeon]
MSGSTIGAQTPGGSSDSGSAGTTGPMIKRSGGSSNSAMILMGVVIIVLLVVVAGFYAGWFKGPSHATTGAGGCPLPAISDLTGTGSTLVAPLMDQWETSYWGGTVVNYNALGSSAGITAITGKTVDFGASDAPLDPAQQTSAAGVLTIPESAGGVVPIYNLPGVGELNFNGTVLAEIFDGAIMNWNNTPLQALNPHTTLPNVAITPVHRSDGSGTTFIFMSFLTADDKTWAKTYGKSTAWPTNISGIGEAHNSGVAAYVVENDDTIGYVDLNYALNAGSGIGIGTVQNPHGNYIYATVADTASALVDADPTLPSGSSSWYDVSVLNAPGAGDYPITSLTYVLVYQNLSIAYSSATLTHAENLVDFLHWILTTGQSYSADLYFVPLPASIIAHDNTTIASMTFDGGSIPVCVP